MNERLEQAIAAYHDGTLDEAGSQVLVAALRGSDADAVRERMAFEGLLGQAFTADEAVERSVRERIDGERSASAVVRAVRGSLATTTRRQRRARRSDWLPRVAVAALLLVVVGVGWWLSGRAQPQATECRLEVSLPLVITRGGASVRVASGEALVAGDRITASAAATLVWSDGSRVVLAPEAQVDLTRPALGPGCRLLQGTATAAITPQRAGLPFTIATPEARIEVLGTHFQVMTGTSRTQVDLHDGIVRLTRTLDGRSVTMRAQESVVVAPGVGLVVHSLVSAAPAVAVGSSTMSPAPAEPAWAPLFADTGLDGWVPQHGAWSNQHGVIRGSDQQHGKARLLGHHPFADLELRCRLRISGVDFAEIQVGDYNWFAEVPAHGDQWIQVEVRQRGNELRITADGVTLTNKPGDGAAMRAGPLAFYVMPGGTLEIAEAQVRIPKSVTPTSR